MKLKYFLCSMVYTTMILLLVLGLSVVNINVGKTIYGSGFKMLSFQGFNSALHALYFKVGNKLYFADLSAPYNHMNTINFLFNNTCNTFKSFANLICANAYNLVFSKIDFLREHFMFLFN